MVVDLPHEAKARFHFAAALAGTGNRHEAKKQYALAIHLQPTLAPAHQALAWLLATSEGATPDDVAEAVRSAEKGAQLTGHKLPLYLDTLAAAYASAGRFEDAVHWQTRAVEMTPEEDRADYLNRLKIYHGGQPYRRPTSG